jgi:hypothetical protein
MKPDALSPDVHQPGEHTGRAVTAGKIQVAPPQLNVKSAP